jgi:hypothetical protein
VYGRKKHFFRFRDTKRILSKLKPVSIFTEEWPRELADLWWSEVLAIGLVGESGLQIAEEAAMIGSLFSIGLANTFVDALASQVTTIVERLNVGLPSRGYVLSDIIAQAEQENKRRNPNSGVSQGTPFDLDLLLDAAMRKIYQILEARYGQSQSDT